MNKILIKIINVYYALKLHKEEKKELKKHKKFKKLTRDEKKRINKKNRNICRIFKNINHDWENIEKEYFVSDYFYQTELLPKLNKFNYNKIGLKNKKSYFLDKNYQSMFVNNFPNEIIRCIDGEFRDKDYNYITETDALNKMNSYDKLVFKCSIGTAHGKGVAVFEKKEYSNALKKFGKNYVVQTLIKQHKDLSKYNKSSVNVIRITSLLWEDEVYIIGAILRVGAPGSFCDHLGKNGNNPRIVAINEDGSLDSLVIDPDDIVRYDDFFGIKPDGKIPKFEEMKEWAKKQHIKYPHHKLIGWDLTVDENENIVCIEFNSLVPGIIQTQMVCGPIFAKKTSKGTKILDEILERK